LTLCAYAHNVIDMNYRKSAIYAEILKALAHPMRIRIIDELKLDDRCVSDLLALGNINQSNVSRHLATLKHVGLISDKRIMNRVVYHLETPEILDIFDSLAAVARKDLKRRNARSKDV